jgi:hypothetical protein
MSGETTMCRSSRANVVLVVVVVVVDDGGERRESLPPFHTGVHGCIRRFPLDVIKIPATDVSLRPPPSPPRPNVDGPVAPRRGRSSAEELFRGSRFASSIPAIVPRNGSALLLLLELRINSSTTGRVASMRDALMVAPGFSRANIWRFFQ